MAIEYILEGPLYIYLGDSTDGYMRVEIVGGYIDRERRAPWIDRIWRPFSTNPRRETI